MSIFGNPLLLGASGGGGGGTLEYATVQLQDVGMGWTGQLPSGWSLSDVGMSVSPVHAIYLQYTASNGSACIGPIYSEENVFAKNFIFDDSNLFGSLYQVRLSVMNAGNRVNLSLQTTDITAATVVCVRPVQ